MYLIVGLGNIGKQYENTYHNCGFMVLDRLAKNFNLQFKKGECLAKTCEYYNNGNKFLLAKPQTYMNLSGESVRRLVKKYKIDFGDILIIYDDVDLSLGQIRAKLSGSGGTHNGMRNIIDNLGTETFKRIRIGIGKPEFLELRDYVTSKITAENFEIINTGLDNAFSAVKNFTDGTDFLQIMQIYNKSS
ncbi:MAG: aminoacyl-tRNA hydrolase [Firmicutes bacterium]|nr:aminoacyl-tRNA hydrolase [Bacillota bacterium]